MLFFPGVVVYVKLAQNPITSSLWDLRLSSPESPLRKCQEEVDNNFEGLFKGLKGREFLPPQRWNRVSVCGRLAIGVDLFGQTL